MSWTGQPTGALRPSAGSATLATLVLTHAPTRTALVALPAASREAAPACDWHRSIETGARPALVVSGRRSSACSLRSSPRVGAVMRLESCRCVPFGSPHRQLPVKAPGADDITVTLRLASAWSRLWTPAPRYRCSRIEAMSSASLLQSTVFNEHPRVAATSDLLAQSLLSSTRPLWPRCASRAGASSLSGDAASPWFRRDGLG